MKLNSNSLKGHRVLKLITQLAKWDDFRQADWSEMVDTPDLILQQTRELLQIASARPIHPVFPIPNTDMMPLQSAIYLKSGSR